MPSLKSLDIKAGSPGEDTGFPKNQFLPDHILVSNFFVIQYFLLKVVAFESSWPVDVFNGAQFFLTPSELEDILNLELEIFEKKTFFLSKIWLLQALEL